jgi:hypothetical protein
MRIRGFYDMDRYGIKLGVPSTGPVTMNRHFLQRFLS